jgi:hypothetical protein
MTLSSRIRGEAFTLVEGGVTNALRMYIILRINGTAFLTASPLATLGAESPSLGLGQLIEFRREVYTIENNDGQGGILKRFRFCLGMLRFVHDRKGKRLKS